MTNNISILDQLATFALDGTEKARADKPGAIAMGEWAMRILRTELPDVDPKDIGAVLLIFSSLVASAIEGGEGQPTALGIGNLAAMTGAHLYAEKEL